ncbi:non-ribosomal peptide synthetase [[Flexibacter] sp. ATCC 35208]|uniref:non-ribosomal peptide synthetase n=1 Tax=[Flexibacter] sp. ATCC 35208 TaxID=1936242 RepID=UPI0009C2A08D|nr:non-ribosomal peptide synthetase [[Flexibacter] sp. ATCC 35208]AQX14460.1 SQ 28,332 NRPS biosynthetic scaffold 1 [[Flexibacter] sp. ATCC 35208]OMP77242.1 hypothetical protein BW716_20700 [[Flexibacter] sp. ATCC 35208]
MKKENFIKTLAGVTAKDLVKLPRTNEKVPVANTTYLAPGNAVEEDLLVIWNNLLNQDGLGIHHDFFRSGGNSIKATQLVSRITKHFQVDIRLTDIFRNTTIEKQALLIQLQEKVMQQTIRRLPQQEDYAVSHAQRRLWFINQFSEGVATYHIPVAGTIKGNLDKTAFYKAFELLLARHESLRTVFSEIDGEPRQRILHPPRISDFLQEYDATCGHINGQTTEQLLAAFIAAPFDLESSLPVRVALITIAADEHVFACVMHHIVSDGSSMEILMKELAAVYNALCQGKENPLSPLEVHYRDFAAWQQELLSGQDSNVHHQYWLQQFSGEVPVLELPTDFSRPVVKSYKGNVYTLQVDSSVHKTLIDTANRSGASLFMVLQATLYALFYRYTGQEDIVLGTVTAGRDYSDLEEQVGLYANTLALRTRFSGEDNFDMLLAAVKNTTLQSFEHQQYPFDQLVGELKLARNLSRSALFDVMIVLHNNRTALASDFSFNGAVLESYALPATSSKFDLTFNFRELNGILMLSIEYDTALFTPGYIHRMADHWQTLIKSVEMGVGEPLSRLDYMTEQERNLLLYTLNDTMVPPVPQTTVHALIEAQVIRTPTAIALITGDGVFNYHELNIAANRFAHYLHKSVGLQPNDRIGILVDRSAHMLIAMLAVMKAGAAYVPLDAGYPVDRVAYIAENSRITSLLTERNKQELYEQLPVKSICLEDIWQELEQYPINNLEQQQSREDSMYVLYTSGSTGLPKGVDIPHRAALNLLTSMQKEPGIDASDVLLAVTTCAFDISVLELFLPLISGAAVRLASASESKDPALLNAILDTGTCTIMQATPSTWRMLIEQGWQGTTGLKILCGGERLSPELAQSLLQRCGSLYNVYGPTETTVWSAVNEITTAGVRITIGKPIANTQLYVLDQHRAPAATLVAGELYIGGTGLAKGYLFRTELTTERFVDNPFITGTRMYRTGDIARWLPEGQIEIMGRVDEQVKVRGFRIEPAEIETAILKYTSAGEAVVVADTTTGEPVLVAYVAGSITEDISDMRNNLRKVLPEYMLPAYIVPLPELPLTPNGKVNKKALPGVKEMQTQLQTTYTAPRNPQEQSMVNIWSEILGLSRIGVDDNFFQLGGHSLKATQVVSRVHQQMGIRLHLQDIFIHPTISGLCSILQERNSMTAWAIEPAIPQDSYPLSDAQRRLWILQQWEQTASAYHMSNAFYLEGQLNIDALRLAFKTLIVRHESLRTRFEVLNGEPRQVIVGPGDITFELEYEDLRNSVVSSQDIQARVTANAHELFNLQQGALIRALLLQTKDTGYVFALTMHHIISDGWSMGVMVREVLAMYEAFRTGMSLPFPPLDIHYKDYTMWQQHRLQEEEIQETRNYWLQRFGDDIPVLELPLNHERPAVKSYRGEAVKFVIEESLVKALEDVAQQQEATLFMALLAATNALLYRYTGQEDIVIGSPVAGRAHASLESQIGFYVNTLALRTRFSGNSTFYDLLHNSRTTSLEAYEHQLYPFDQLVDELNLERVMNRNPLFDVMVVLQNTNLDNRPLPALQELEISSYTMEHRVSKFDWWLSFSRRENGLSAMLEYDSALFTRESMLLVTEHFRNLLALLVKHPGKAVSSHAYLTPTEITNLLQVFNNTVYPFMVQETLVSLFEKTVTHHSGNIALVAGNTTYTYNSLNETANRLAHYLRDGLHVQPDEPIGLLLDRSPAMVIGMLGILKAGGAYVPIDPEYPENRIRYIVEDSGLRILITHPQQRIVSELPCEKILLTDDLQVLASWPGHNPEPVITPHNLAYIIYTSGSTGQPKGCELEHRSIVNRIQWMQEHYRFTADDRILQKTAYVFDVSVWEFFMTLCFGARLVLCSRDMVYSPQALINIINREGITTLHFVPSMFNTFLSVLAQESNCNMASLRHIFTSGEALQLESVQQHHRLLPAVKLHNLYGPTEAAVDVTYFETDSGTEKVLIGQPIWNTGVYILDRHGNLVPPGIYGEIHLGGIGLARGYRNKGALTTEKFIPHPFAEGERLYKTGDVGRFLPNGLIEYAGRNDDQVKIRGYRIELGEVAAAILKHPAIDQAVALTIGSSQEEKSLAAYLVCSSDALHVLEDTENMHAERVAEWQSIFEHTYREEEDKSIDPLFNIKGWNSSYTGLPIPAEEMLVWVNDIVNTVLHYQPGNVLEIGCGTGLLLFRIAPYTQRYVGTEISAVAIEYLTECIRTIPGSWDHVTLLQRPAHLLSHLETASFDTVLINSVIQYFPNASYLTDTIATAIRLLRPGGQLIIGDVRSLPLATQFHGSVAYSKAAASTTVTALQQQILTVLDHEKELLVDPAYFISLQEQLPGIGWVEIVPKKGDYENELSRFRYQVIIHVSQMPAAIPAFTWLNDVTLTDLKLHLDTAQPRQLGIAAVHNSRLQESNLLMKELAAAHATDAISTLHERMAQTVVPLMDERAVLELAAAANYNVYLGWGRQQDGGCYDIILTADSNKGAILPSMLYYELLRQDLKAARGGAYTNNPISQQLKDKLVPALRSFLKMKVPEYMIPTYFTLLDKFPLTINGKLDRKALPSPVAARAVAGAVYVAPRTELEVQLAVIWKEVLKLDTVGIYDNFFDLGGHSLKATQVVSRMHQQSGIRLDLRTLFSFPTIAGLAVALEGHTKEVFETIPVATAQSSYPLSNAQRRLWMLNEWEEAALAYNMSSAYALEGPLDLAALQQAFTWLVKRHESMRTRFVKVAAMPRQVIIPVADAGVQLKYVTAEVQDVKAMVRAHASQRFDLEQGPLISILLIHVTDTQHVLALNMHHIVSDGWSMDVLMKELITHYVTGQPLPSLRIQYKDYTLWQNSHLTGASNQYHRTYWLQRFNTAVPVLELSLDFTRPPVKTYHGNNMRFNLDAATTNALRQLANASGASTFMALLAVVNTLLYRYTGQEDIVIGSPIAGRHHPDLEDQVGFYVNTLALRTTFSGSATFTELLDRVRKDTLDAYEHQIYPFDSLVEELQLSRDTSRSPLFDVMVVLQNTGDNTSQLPAVKGLSISPYSAGSAGISKVDLSFYFHETTDGMSVNIEYNTDLFMPGRIERMFSHFEGLCRAVTANKNVPLQQLDYLPAAEKEKLLFAFSGQPLAYPAHKTMQQLLEEQALLTPHHTALVTDTDVFTYEVLNRRANQLAHYILAHPHFTPGALVGLMTARNDWMVVSMLAVLKAGAAYVPIDINYPPNRIHYILQDATVQLILTSNKEMTASYVQEGVALLELNEALQTILQAYPVTNPVTETDSAAVAYCIYTSGSTGQPKGIQLTHRNVVAFLYWAIQEFATDDFNTVFATTSYCFDLSVFEIFYTLCTGKYIRLLQSGADIIHFLDKDEKILLNTVPSVIDNLLAADVDFSRVNVINVAGEPVPLHFRQQLDYERIAVRNLYGPSEDTTYSSCYRFAAGHNNIPIGKPIANTQFYILDAQQQLLSEGITGEICIAGDCLSMGYLNQPELNARQFIQHPTLPGKRIYRTGDLGRWLPDGNMEYVGRLDFQVKVHGFRIELGEIETALSRYPGIRHNVVAAIKDSNGKQQLVAWLQAEKDNVPEILSLQFYLRNCLPQFMIPSAFVVLEEFPLNQNGKIDRKRLPLPDENITEDSGYTAPRNEIEMLLATAWQKVLGKQRISIHDNYFNLGGDSIRAIQIIAHLHGKKLLLKMSDFFQYPTISMLAPKVMIVSVMASQEPVTGEIPFTPIQLDFLANSTPGYLHHYNQAVMLYAPEGFDKSAIKAVFSKITAHHDALRIVLQPKADGEWRQQNLAVMPLHLEEHTITKSELTALADALQAGINLEGGPLMKLALFHLPDGDRLLIAAHHMVIDGVSWRILFEDIQRLYGQYMRQEALELPYKTEAYKVWAEQLKLYAGTVAAMEEQHYWQQITSATVPAIPCKGSAEDNLVKYKEKKGFRLDQQETAQLLTEVNAAFNSQIDDILLVALLRAIYKMYGYTATAIALEGHGREEILPGIDVSRTVGWFTAIYPVIFNWDEQLELSRHIKVVKEHLRKIPNRGIGYGILKYLGAATNKELFNLQPQISFNYLGQFDADLQHHLFTIAPETAGALQAPEARRPHDWEVTGMIAGNCLTMSVSFSSKQYDMNHMEAFMQYYKEALQDVIAHCLSRETTELTPSDFTYKHLSIDAIDNLFD